MHHWLWRCLTKISGCLLCFCPSERFFRLIAEPEVTVCVAGLACLLIEPKLVNMFGESASVKASLAVAPVCLPFPRLGNRDNGSSRDDPFVSCVLARLSRNSAKPLRLYTRLAWFLRELSKRAELLPDPASGERGEDETCES